MAQEQVRQKGGIGTDQIRLDTIYNDRRGGSRIWLRGTPNFFG